VIIKIINCIKLCEGVRRKKGNLFNNICENIKFTSRCSFLYNCHFTQSVKSANYFLKDNIILKNGRRVTKHYITLKNRRYTSLENRP
jgi:hypothetical protein